MAKKTGFGKSVILYSIAGIFAQIINFLLLPVYTRYLDTSDYGILSVVVIFIGVYIQVIILGSDQAIGRLYFDDGKDFSFKKYLGTIITFSLVWGKHPLVKWVGLILMITGLAWTGYGLIRPYYAHKKLSQEPDFFEQKVLKPAQTLEDLHELARTYPDNPLVFEKLGWVYAKEKKWEDAIKNYLKTVELDPERASAYNNLGNIYFTINQRGKAQEYYLKALAINPDLVDAHVNLGISYYFDGELKQSAERMKKVLELDPRNTKAQDILRRMVE